MRELLIGSLVILSFVNSAKADSELKLKACVTTAYKTAASDKGLSKEVIKTVNAAVRDCRKAVADEVKAERVAKKRSKLEAQIKKLQAKLSSN
jgi:hypothetical protein